MVAACRSAAIVDAPELGLSGPVAGPELEEFEGRGAPRLQMRQKAGGGAKGRGVRQRPERRRKKEAGRKVTH
jgi:hypothetical protein